MNGINLADFVFDAAREVFQVMLGIELSTGVVHSDSESIEMTDRVVAFIGLAGEYIGTGMISCSPQLACRISSLMLMSDYQSVDGDVLDAMGEVANMIFGNVKNRLEEEIGPFGLSVPTVIFGRDFSTRNIGKQSWITVPLKAEGYDFDARICMAPGNRSDESRKYGLKRQVSLSEA